MCNSFAFSLAFLRKLIYSEEMRKFVIPLHIFILTLLLFPIRSVNAVEVKMYQITEAQEFIGNPYLPTILWHKTIPVPWKSGKVIISGNPDGTGNMDVGVQFEVYGSDTSKRFIYNAGCEEKPMPPLDITHIMGPKYPHLGDGDSQIFIRYNRLMCNNWIKEDNVTKAYIDISPAYIVHFDDNSERVTPFLSLPWNYQSKGKTFNDAALRMYSWFDHKYPLISTTFSERSDADLVTTFAGLTANVPYSGHDGYDWARMAGIVMNEPVLAAADGVATYKYWGDCGNMIMIDHGNSFQTRYCHLSNEGLITKSSAVQVSRGQEIGKVGMSGRTTGPHIHFMIVEDKNNDGNFDDNIPDGILDPFGWQGSEQDPWEAYTFVQNAVEKSGNKSHYLWNSKLAGGTYTLTPDGKKFSVGDVNVEFPMQIVSHDVIVNFQELPPVQNPTIDDIIEGTIHSVSNRVRIMVHDGFGLVLDEFQKYLTVTIPFDETEVERYDPDTLSIYSSADGITWKRENSFIDISSNTVKTEVNHLTEFALMGEKLDAIPPESNITVEGTQIDDYYLPGVMISISVVDDQTESLGVENTFYRINGEEMQIYTEALALTEKGTYQIEYYSVDGDGNEEELKSIDIIVNNPPPQPSPTASAGEATPTSGAIASATATPAPIEKPKHDKKEKKKKKKKIIKNIATLRRHFQKLLSKDYVRHYLIVMLNLIQLPEK